jgi:transcription termination factor Rho
MMTDCEIYMGNSMAKKRYRPRTSGGRGGSGGGNGGGSGRPSGGGRSGGGPGGNKNRRRRRPDGPRRPPGGQPVPEDEGDVELYDALGMLEMHPNGYGFLRSPENSYSRERSDPFVPGTMIEKFGLREGVMINGKIQPARRQTGPRLREIVDVDGMPPEEFCNVPTFESKTPINPEHWYNLETGPEPLTTRVIDMLAPMGRGQRGLIVAPPRTGKTVMLQHISNGISTNHPDVKLVILLIDERPEEVTDMRRNVNGEVIASSLDEDVESHVRLSQLVIERCKRLAEMGQDVFLLMDSITRLARAFNKWVGNSGRIMSGGVDIKAMDIPKKLFATARAFEEGGSLTIIGTALIDTGSRMDELIFQEFKGTGNMELVLDRKLADRRVWPAIDIHQSGTRREELLLSADTLHAITMLRRTLGSMHHVEAMEQLTKQLLRFKTNEEFIQLISGKMGVD